MTIPKAISPAMAQALLLCIGLSAVGCSNPLNPEAGLPLPKDPGTVTVRVFDDSGSPLANVRVSVTLPNDIGGVFMRAGYTDATGARTFPGVPAGTRPVEVEPPGGFDPGTGGLVQRAEVREGRTTTVTFTLIRAQP